MQGFEICILAGGLSTRMGRDKSRASLAGRTLLQRVRDVARQTKCPVRVIRRDLMERCGPLGGIHTALQTTGADAVLFLACDMPFITLELLEMLIDRWPGRGGALFTKGGDGEKAGFPFILSRALAPVVERQMRAADYSLQALATACGARFFKARSPASVLFNVNTPEELAHARKRA